MANEDGCARLLKRAEVAEAMELLRVLDVSYGGLHTQGLYRLLCTSRSMLALVRPEQGRLAGIAVIELDRRWVWSHPWQTAQMLLRRGSRRRQSSETLAEPQALPFEVSREKCPVSWHGPAARTIFIGVHPQYRGRGAGSALYQEAFRQLEQRGRAEFLARIDPHNTASLILHLRTGWQLYFDGRVVTGLKRLGQ